MDACIIDASMWEARARVCLCTYACIRVCHVCMLDCLKAELARIFIGHLRKFFESEAINLCEILRKNSNVSDYTINGCS